MLSIVVVGILVAVAVGATYTVVSYIYKAKTGETIVERWLMKIVALQLRPQWLAERRGSWQLLSLVISLVAVGLVLILGIGMFSEAQGTISPPTDPNALAAYNKTVDTVWKSFQLSPLALLATVFGVIISAIVGGFAIIGRRD